VSEASESYLLFVDANTLTYHFQPHPTWGPACTQFLERIKNPEVAGFTSTHVLAEVAPRLMTLEATTVLRWPIPGIGNRLRTHLHGRLFRQRQEVGIFPAHAALLGVQVAPVQLDEPVPGQLPQPGVEGERPTAEVVGQFLGGVGQGFLDHVGGIDPRHHTAVHAERDHLPQLLAVAAQQLLAGVAVAAAGTLDQRFGIWVVAGRHGNHLIQVISL
jgi:hypothetical protein